ncbi:cell division protein FtsK, partial [Streptomyces mirabilis]
MKHPDDENELFNRLEAELSTNPGADSGGEVVDLDKARTARTGSADPSTRLDADPSADSAPDRGGAVLGAPRARALVGRPGGVA